MYFLGFQITLKLDPETEVKKFGPKPGPLDEVEVTHIPYFSFSVPVFISPLLCV